MTGSPIGGALRQMHHLFVEGTAAGLPDGQLLERFLARGDGAAFAALVQRHGPMVLGICHSILRNPADAEDAFQATFLVLVCKGRSIRGQESLGGWLRQVAHRVAVQAGADAVRRRAREQAPAQVVLKKGVTTIGPRTGGRSCTRSSPPSRRSIDSRCCSATSRARRTRRPPRSSVAARPPCSGGSMGPACSCVRGCSDAGSRRRPGCSPPVSASRLRRRFPQTGSRRPCGRPDRGAPERAGSPSAT